MAIYQLAYYQVKTDAIDDCKRAIEEFVEYIKTDEPGTEVYWACQQISDPTHFVHLFRFSDKKAQKIHGSSKAVKKFESVYRPVLLSNGVDFINYDMVAGKFPKA